MCHMGACISIEANSAAEFEALESEGAPSMGITYSSVAELLRAFGLEHLDCEADRVEPVEILNGADRARRWARTYGFPQHVIGADKPINFLASKVETMIEIAESAQRLGRNVSWA